MIIIGDVHGCFKTLMALIDKLPKGEHICFTGDLIDRGTGVREVVEFIKNSTYDCVLGNHEDMMSLGSELSKLHITWVRNGGEDTIESYKERDEIYKDHSEWLKGLPLFKYYPGIKDKNGRSLIVSHSDIGAVEIESLDKWKDSEMFKHHVLWERSDFIHTPDGVFNVLVHTPNKAPIITDQYANVDTGCCFNHGGYTKLTALRFPEMEIIQQENID